MTIRSRETISIVIPALNEEAGIARSLAELQDVLTRHDISAEIIVVDDGSDDGTAETALRAGARVLRHRSNRGYGASLKTGVLAAPHSIVAIMDADGTYPAEYLPALLEKVSHSDMVVAARTGKVVHIPLVRRPAKWVLNQLANYVSGHRIPDLNSGMRVFRKEVLVQYLPILPNYFSFTTTITLALLCDNYAVEYVPISYRARTGRSKIVPWDAASFTVLILRMAFLFKPLRVFLPLTILCFLYGAGKAFVDLAVVHDRNISASAVLAVMTGIIMLFMGMLADAIATRFGKVYPNVVAGARAAETTEMRLPDETSETTTAQHMGESL